MFFLNSLFCGCNNRRRRSDEREVRMRRVDMCNRESRRCCENECGCNCGCGCGRRSGCGCCD